MLKRARKHPEGRKSGPDPSLFITIPGKHNFSSRSKKQMNRPMTRAPRSNEMQHPKNAGNLRWPMGQTPAHETKPSPEARGIVLDQTDLTIAARKALREEAGTQDASTACSPADRYLPLTKVSAQTAATPWVASLTLRVRVLALALLVKSK